MPREFKLNVNGQEVAVATDEDRPLLDVLREDLQLTGTKYGCGEGECGACTVLMDGAAIRSCVTTVADAVGLKIETIEGLSPPETLHPVQEAFLEHEALQCGYCVPGQIMSAVALLRENASPSREEIIEHMGANICRCCNYPSILAAIEHSAGR